MTLGQRSKFSAKYKCIGDISIYGTEEEALERDEDWVVIKDKLYSKRW